jgi:hypothetical protein
VFFLREASRQPISEFRRRQRPNAILAQSKGWREKSTVRLDVVEAL